MNNVEMMEAAVRANPDELTLRRAIIDALIESGRTEKQAQRRAYRVSRSGKNARDAKNERTAIAFGRSYHERCADLYRSLHADVQYGHGGEEIVDWDTTARNPHTGHKVPRKWKNAGAWVDDGKIVLENHLGKEVERLPLPPSGWVMGLYLDSGDLFAVRRTILGIPVRVLYGVSKRTGGYIRTGYVVQRDSEWIRPTKEVRWERLRERRQAANGNGVAPQTEDRKCQTSK